MATQLKLRNPHPVVVRYATFALDNAIYGGADFSEVATTRARIGDGDADRAFREWTATADRLFALGEESALRGHPVSARNAFLRASNYYRAAYPPLFGAPTDPRVVEGHRREARAFRRAAAFFEGPCEFVEIDFQGAKMPAYFLRPDGTGAKRKTLICVDGYDDTVEQMYFLNAVAALQREYNVLMFDGPGQGAVLYEQGVPMRPDWENVVAPVVDYALTRNEVDPERIALCGESFGGYLAPRAASGEHRVAALVADPGQWSLLETFRALLPLSSEQRAALPNVDESVLRPFVVDVNADPELHWMFVQRGYWVHGVDSMLEYLKASAAYTMVGRAELIRCPTLVIRAENDPVAMFARKLYVELRCPKTFLSFAAADGAGDHCEMSARAFFHQRVFDWLDEALA